MPPPSPYNLNRFVVIGGAVMIVTGFFATRGSKPFPDMEKAAPEPVSSPSSSVAAIADAAVPEREASADEARFRACARELSPLVQQHPVHQKALSSLNLRVATPFGARLSFAEAAAECEKIAGSLDAGVDPSPGPSASKKPCPPGVPNCE